jgi:chromosome partitioning protein
MIEADLVLMPVTPGAADVWALQETLTVLEDAQSMRPEIEAAVVMNRTDRTKLSSTAKAALGDLPVPILSSSLGNRVAFGEATLAGEAVVDYAPDSQAAIEINALVKEVLATIGGKSDGKKGRGARSRRVQATDAGSARAGH